MKALKSEVFFVTPEKRPVSGKQYLTATEVIDGVKCVITLEKDREGHYQEIKFTPAKTVSTGIMA